MKDYILERLTTFVVREFLDGDASGLSPSTPLLEWGVLDSMSMLALLDFIDQDLRIAVPDEHVRPEHFQNLDFLSTMLAGLSPRQTPSASATPGSVASRVANAGHGVKTIAVQAAGRVLPVAHAPGPRPGWLLIPGPLNPSVAWGAVLRTQVDVAATWAPSLIGLGPDDDGHAGATYSSQVDAMDQIAGALDRDGPIVLVGNGLGGAIAAEIAKCRPGRVAALVVVAFGVLEDPWGWWQGQARDTGSYLERAFFQAPTVTPALRHRIEALLSSPAYQRFLTEPEAARLSGVFDDLRVPTLFVGAQDDRIVPRRAVEVAAETVPDARLEWLARCGHLAHLERSQELLALIRGFVADAAPVAGGAPAA